MNRQLILIVAGWTLLIAVLIWWNFATERTHVEEQARIEARAVWDHNLSYRKWITAMGGVYVRRDRLAPNPYLTVPDRDKTTVDGIALTMVNPAYMTNQVFDIIRSESELPIINRIVSENYLNPRNKPDEWEAASLRAITAGKTEVSEVTVMGGQPYIRLMKPLITIEGCLKCHGQQGYKTGDIRGGISVAIPMKHHYALESHGRRTVLLLFLPLWGLGTGAIVLFLKRMGEKQALVRESEEKYRFFVESANDAVMIHTIMQDGRPGPFFLVNELACERFGYTREEFARLSPQELNDPQHLGHIPVVMEKLKKEGRAVFETVMVRKDGSRVPVEISTRLLLLKGAPHILSLVRDISERKQAEESLRKSNEVVERIFSMTTTCIAYLDRGFNFLRVNRQYALADKKPPEFYAGKNHFELFPSEDNEAIFRRVVETGEQYEARAKPFQYEGHPERGISYWDWTLTPVKDRAGKVDALILSLIDVTDRIAAQEELRRLNAELEERIKMRTRELEAKNAELERMNKLFVGRELRMAELKERIRQMEERMNRETGA